MSRILVLPGSKWQLPLVRKILELGHEAVVVSPENNPPCRKQASEFLQCNIFDVDIITEYCKIHPVNAVVSDECDIAMPVVAELGKRLKLRTLSQNDASLFTNKFLMREFCANHGLNFPEYRLCKKAEEANSLLQQLGRPLVIKPLDSNASHGVFTVHTEEELKEHFNESLLYSRTGKAVLAERYINGTEFTIDGIKTPLGHYTLAISEKKHFTHNPNISYELFFTHYSADFDFEELKLINDQFIMQAGLEYGFTHAEYKLEGGVFYLIEIAARGGGNEISSIITQYMSGYDTYRYLVNCSLGMVEDKSFFIDEIHRDRACVLYFFHVPNGGGKVKKITGGDFLKGHPDILDYSLNFSVGDRIKDAENDSVRIGYYIAGKENRAELENFMDEINQIFKIEVE